MTVEPGRQLAGRYRVEDLLAERAGARLWRAVDEVLRRSVAVEVLPSSSSRAAAMVQAARRAAVVTDGRFLRVLDAAEENGDVYVVREWARGESLELVLAEGPLPHRRAAWIVHEVAEAVSVAHSADIHHLRLLPQNVLVTDTGGVKIIGLATDAAIHGVDATDPEAEDVRGLGRLLYAALVARWPNGAECSLPPAPVEHDRLLRPAQVRAGVPRRLDEVCARILCEPVGRTEPLRHASAVALELSDTARLAGEGAPKHDPEATQAAGFAALAGGYEPTASLHVPEQRLSPAPDGRRDPMAHPAPAARSDAAAGDRTAAFPAPDGGPSTTRRIPAMPAPSSAPVPAQGAPAGGHSYAPPPEGAAGPVYAGAPRSGSRRGWAWAGAVTLVAALASVSFYLGYSSTGDEQNQAAGPGADSGTAADPVQPVRIASATAFDPFGEEGENDDEAAFVHDGDPSTQWTTLSYEGDPEFGGLKPGLGLVLDLGRPVDVQRVRLDLAGSGTDLQVRAAPATASTPPSAPGGYRTVARLSAASGDTVVRMTRPVSTRFLLVWLTRLPPESGGTYRGFVNEITVEG